MLPGWIELSMKYQSEKPLMGGIGKLENTMDVKLNNYNTPVDGDCKNAVSCVSTGQLKIKGGFWKNYDFVYSIFAHYLGSSSKKQVCQFVSSPKNQVRRLGGHKPNIIGKRIAILKRKSELNGSYGRFGKSFKRYFLLTISNNKGEVL